MSLIDEVRAKRQKLADVLFDDEYSGIRRIVEDLYPDRAHFIYELLQNAEDAAATEAVFRVTTNTVFFEHNGRPFNEDDVWGITNIGKGTKEDSEDTIGRFGIGFKAVFAYTETPHIWSPEYSFEIRQLVLPTSIPKAPNLDGRTRFEFPFNNPKKPARDAYEEVGNGLEEITETTLLYLTNLARIRWTIDDETTGAVQRISHTQNHIEIVKSKGGVPVSRSHFLRFSAPVADVPHRHVAVALELDNLPQIASYDPKEPLSRQLKIVPSNPGRVAVYFPAEKEVSGLRFHLHAPFVPDLSRASVKDTPANDPLFDQLAELAAMSLHAIRDLGLLSGDFLGVLPNPQDQIPLKYHPIRTAIIEAMMNEALTPTYSKSNAPAKDLVQARALLKDLLTEDDLRFLLPGKVKPQWAIGATQRNSNQDRFLSGLAITDWDVREFIKALSERCSDGNQYLSHLGWFTTGPDEAFLDWMGTKSADWHQNLYHLLYRELEPTRSFYQLQRLRIVRLSDGTYSTGDKCYFPSDEIEHDPVLPRVDKAIFTAGKNTTRQEEAKKLLREIGVREVGEAEQVESILRQRYGASDFKPDLKDLERFVALLEKEPNKSTIFSNSYIFKLKDGEWEKPSQVYLDKPYEETGLRAYFEALGPEAQRYPLSEDYQSSSITIERICRFAKAVGVQTDLTIKRTSTTSHRFVGSLRADYYNYRVRRTDTQIDEDWVIPDLELLLRQDSEALSLLIWRTLRKADERVLTARYRPNQQYETREKPSTLVLLLRENAWVPQGTGEFVRPSAASKALLPKGFVVDEREEWVRAIGFGEEENQRLLQQIYKESSARQLGFSDEQALQDAQWFAAIGPEERQYLKEQFERKRQRAQKEQQTQKSTEDRALDFGQALTEAFNRPGRIMGEDDEDFDYDDNSGQEVRDPARRSGKLAEGYRGEISSEPLPKDRRRITERSLLEGPNERVRISLREWYGGKCQICGETWLERNGEPYFAAAYLVERRHARWLDDPANAICLCAKHFAQWRHAAIEMPLSIPDQIRSLKLRREGGNGDLTIAFVLLGADVSITYAERHFVALRTLLEVTAEISEDRTSE